MVLYFFNSLSSSLRKYINLLFFSLKVLTYPLILGNVKTNGLITSSKYPIKYLELAFVSVNFEATVLSALTSESFLFLFFLHHKNVRYFCLTKSQQYYIIKKILSSFFN